MTGRMSEIYRRACMAGLIGVPLLLLVGLVGWLLWIVISVIRGNTLDWSLVVWTWGALFFLSAILGMFGGHWNRRIANWWQGRGPDAPHVAYILTMSMALPVAVFAGMSTRLRNEGIPVWLWVLGGLSAALGVASFVDRQKILGRLAAAGTKKSRWRRG